MIEIEKRFLLNKFPNEIVFNDEYIINQVYWSFDYKNNFIIIKNIAAPIKGKIFNNKKLLRLRIQSNKDYIVLNQKIGKAPIKNEIEYKIYNKQLFDLIENTEIKIQKIRYEKKYTHYTMYIDKFLGYYSGLIIAEIEFKNKKYINCDLPDFLKNEITQNKNYSNKHLFLEINSYISIGIKNDN